MPVSGSKAFVNYHHYHEDGTYLCPECTVKLFFIPLGVVLIGGMAGILHAQTDTVKQFWTRNIIEENLNRLARNSSEGIMRSRFKNPKFAPENALFDFTSDLIRDIDNENQSEYLQLITFTNFGAAPDCAFYVLTNPVFKFLNKVLRYERKRWFNFVRRHFFVKKAQWDLENQVWKIEQKKETIELTDSDYPDHRNLVYQKLLANQSILGQLVSTYKSHFLNNLDKFPLEITIHYVTEVLNMDKEQLNLIGRITDVIFELSQKENNYKKYVVMLEGSRKAYEVRGVLLKIIKANFLNGAKEPLIRLKEYVNYLFPDGTYFGEVRDLLLIHLYEKYHDHQVNYQEIPETTVETTEPETTNSL